MLEKLLKLVMVKFLIMWTVSACMMTAEMLLVMLLGMLLISFKKLHKVRCEYLLVSGEDA